jgi:alpha-mannosidase
VNEPVSIRRERAERIRRQVLPRARRERTSPVDIAAYHVHGEPVPVTTALAATYEAFEVGASWGSAWDTTWFRIRGKVPEDWTGAAAVLVVRLSALGGTGFTCEGMAWRDHKPLQGISPNHDEVVIAEPASGGEDFEIYLEAAANPRVESASRPEPMHMPDYSGAPITSLVACHLARVDRTVEALWEDWSLLTELYDHVDPSGARAAQVLRALDQAGRLLDREDVAGSAERARQALAEVLARGAHASAHRYAAVGNAHIDTAWLWPLRETRRKVARTFATAVRLMQEYPDYHFAASQAQQFAWVKESYPELFEEVRAKVAAGQFEPIGSMWVEADCNLPSGESLVRQILHGKRFFAEEMGVETDSLWLPDVFGYPANLPQILSLTGVRWFMTQKLSWNQWNHFPHHTFWWQGLDGTRILSHFPPADTYVGDLSVQQLDHGARNFAQKDLTDRSMYLFGWGDGGGGPTRHMLERARRSRDLEGLPRVELMSSTEAFQAIEREAPLDELPVWEGELYLEMHRGTYTTHAEVKRGNRRLEWALMQAELWSAAAADLGATYPAHELEQAWKTLLLHQFHDIIPGSSIHWVYQDTAAAYAELDAVVENLVSLALQRIASSVPASGTSVLVFNPLSWARREVVDQDGAPVMLEAPACGWAVQEPLLDVPTTCAAVTTGDNWMDNGILRAQWDDQGLITSLVHLATGREAVAPGAGANLLQLHPDFPNQYDAWDIDRAAFDTVTDLTAASQVELVERHRLRATLKVVRHFGQSVLVQLVRLEAGSPLLRFETELDWHEDHRLLKVSFPLAVQSPRASYEVQFGHLERPTHDNTTWDAARYEVCAHTWADLSESGFGVALLNDSKYGHDIRSNVMRLSLVRAPSWPDPTADRGRHHFTYALLPHSGDLAEGEVVRQAHGLNVPMPVVASVPNGSGLVPAVHSAVRVDNPHVVVSAVKRAEDGRGTIVRLYESSGGHRRAHVSLGRWAGPVPSVALVDLLEQPLDGPLSVEEGVATVELGPFQIMTLLFS